MSKRYNVILDEEVVEKAREHLKREGAKLSPVINNLLEGWIDRMDEQKKGVIKNV